MPQTRKQINRRYTLKKKHEREVPERELARKQAIAECWFRGELSYLLRPNAQRALHEFSLDFRRENPDSFDPIVMNCHRRLGKTYLLLLMCIERCLSKPGQQVKYGAPTYTMARDISRPVLDEIILDCPQDLRPRRTGYEYYFKNPRWEDREAYSVLKILGTDVEEGNRLRGQACDMAALDEAGLMKNLGYLMSSILGPQFAGREDPLTILASTPPPSMDHDFVTTAIPQAIEARTYKVVPVIENDDFTERDERIVLQMCPGRSKESTAWKREALCELIADESQLVIPEFQKAEENIVVDDYRLPSRWQPHVCIDSGWSDYTGVLFAAIDFVNQKLVILDEIFIHYKTTGEIAHLIKEKEADLFPPGLPPPYRIGDCTLQQLDDLRRDYQMTILPAEKHDRDASIALLRSNVLEEKIKILSNCQSLVYQLRCGIWNKSRRDFERTTNLGHCDALAALVYLNKSALWSLNPELAPGYNSSSTFVLFPQKLKQTQQNRSLVRMMNLG